MLKKYNRFFCHCVKNCWENRDRKKRIGMDSELSANAVDIFIIVLKTTVFKFEVLNRLFEALEHKDFETKRFRRTSPRGWVEFGGDIVGRKRELGVVYLNSIRVGLESRVRDGGGRWCILTRRRTTMSRVLVPTWRPRRPGRYVFCLRSSSGTARTVARRTVQCARRTFCSCNRPWIRADSASPSKRTAIQWRCTVS